MGLYPERQLIITVTNTKGGVGKTTLVANLAGYLADLGKRVLCVDADIQPALSSYYPLKIEAPNGLCQLIIEAGIDNVISKTNIPNLDIIYSDDPKGTLQNFILHTADGRQRLHYTLKQIERDYDYILIDTQGAIGPLQESAIFAGEIILSPVRTDKISATEFNRGTVRIVSETQVMAARLGMQIGTMYAILFGVSRTRDANLYAEALTQLFKAEDHNSIRLLKTRIPDTAAYRTAASAQRPVHQIDVRTRGKTPCGLEVMSSLAQELLPDSLS